MALEDGKANDEATNQSDTLNGNTKAEVSKIMGIINFTRPGSDGPILELVLNTTADGYRRLQEALRDPDMRAKLHDLIAGIEKN